MIITPLNFENTLKITINPRRLTEGLFVEFNYKKRDGTASQYDIITLDVFPPGGYVWGLKMNDMTKVDFRKVLNKFDVEIHEEKGNEIQKLDVPEKGKQSYTMVQKLKFEKYYRKFIMSEMSLVRIRPINFNSLI
jgi:hypothetical protein